MRRFLCVSCFSFLFAALTVEAATLHVLLMADTNDRKIGTSVRADLNNVARQVDEIVRFTNMTLNKTELTGNQLVTRRAMGWADQLSVSRDDAVIVYYSGHGFRRRNKRTKWPFLSLEDSSLDFFHLVTAVKEKRPRFFLAISDSCNNFIDRSVGPVTSKSSRSIQAGNYQKLFLTSKGTVIATAASPGQFAWGGSSGGAFTLQFLNRLDGIVRGPSRNATWKNLMQKATVATGSGRTRQKPVFEMSQVEDTRFAAGSTVLALTGKPEKWYPAIVRSATSFAIKVRLFKGGNKTISNDNVSSFDWIPGTFIECKISGKFTLGRISKVSPTRIDFTVNSGGKKRASMKNCRGPKEKVNQFFTADNDENNTINVNTNTTTIDSNTNINTDTNTTTTTENEFQCNGKPARIVRKMGNKRYIVEYSGGTKAVVFRRNCTGGASDTEDVTPTFSEGSRVNCKGKKGKIVRTIGKKLLIDFDNGKRDIWLKSKCRAI